MNNQAFTGHVGVLSEDSPKVFRLLKRQNPALLEELENTYATAFTHGGINEIGILREKGVRFQPRPLRILELLLQGKHRTADPSLFYAALLLKVPDFETIESITPEVRELLGQYHMLNEEHAEECDPKIIPLYLADLLDKARHLHMGPLSSKEQYQQLIQIEKMNNVLSKRAPDELSEKINSWVQLFKKRKDIAPLC